MKDILEEIIAHKHLIIAEQKKVVSLNLLQNALSEEHPQRSMQRALADSLTGIIAEFKRKSPSKGWIKENAQVKEITTAYQESGATALSILTDQTFFGGNIKDLRTARPFIEVPILRKDFIIDEYQLYQAKIIGADAILLIAAALSPQKCKELASIAHELNLEVLLEIHSEKELEHLNPYIDMIGVNNRNLENFHTDVETSFHLAKSLPKNKLWISESGISSPATVKELRQAGFRGFLIGETFMKDTHPGKALGKLINQISSEQ